MSSFNHIISVSRVFNFTMKVIMFRLKGKKIFKFFVNVDTTQVIYGSRALSVWLGSTLIRWLIYFWCLFSISNASSANSLKMLAKHDLSSSNVSCSFSNNFAIFFQFSLDSVVFRIRLLISAAL